MANGDNGKRSYRGLSTVAQFMLAIGTLLVAIATFMKVAQQPDMLAKQFESQRHFATLDRKMEACRVARSLCAQYDVEMNKDAPNSAEITDKFEAFYYDQSSVLPPEIRADTKAVFYAMRK